MNIIHISVNGTIYDEKALCWMCQKPATHRIIPEWRADFSTCDEHRDEAIRYYLTNLPKEKK